jgi:polysaccharide pyruvyl transferase WcaK-like protein
VSMRLHALVLGLKHGRPVVACDPVSGGAKVTSQATALDWPLVVPPEELTAEALDAALQRCVSGELAERVRAAGDRGRAGNAGRAPGSRSSWPAEPPEEDR